MNSGMSSRVGAALVRFARSQVISVRWSCRAAAGPAPPRASGGHCLGLLCHALVDRQVVEECVVRFVGHRDAALAVRPGRTRPGAFVARFDLALAVAALAVAALIAGALAVGALAVGTLIVGAVRRREFRRRHPGLGPDPSELRNAVVKVVSD